MGRHSFQRHLFPRASSSPAFRVAHPTTESALPLSSEPPAASSDPPLSSSSGGQSSSSSTFSSSSRSFSSSVPPSSSSSSLRPSSSSSPKPASSSSSSSSSVITSEHFLVTSVPTPSTSIDLGTPSNFFINPSSTLETTDELPTQTSAPEYPSGTSKNNVGAVSKGFWGNKSAVAGTFTVLALIIVAGIGFIWMVILKKRRRNPSFNDSAYDRFAEPALRDSGRTPSPGPSTMDMHQASPMEAEDSYRDLFYNNQEPPMQYNNYAAYSAQPSLPPQSNTYNNNNNNYAYYANDLLPSPVPAPVVVKQRAPHEPPPSHNLPASLFTTSSDNYAKAIATGKLAPVSFREPVARDSGAYQHSIDSFYGGAGNAARKDNDLL